MTPSSTATEAGDAPGVSPGVSLFRALRNVGLDRKQLSIHEMLTDILEVVEVGDGLKPAHLAGHGEGAPWRLDAFARVAAAAGLRTRRTPAMPPPAERYDCVADEFPLIAAALRARAAPATGNSGMPTVLWIYRDIATAAAVDRLVAGEYGLIAEVLGYPQCCVDHDLHKELGFVRALMRLYETQLGIRGEKELLRAIEDGVTANADPAASEELSPLWRTRLSFPYLGHTACPHCRAQPQTSPSARLNRQARDLAFALDPEFAHGLWRAALGEAALASTGNFQSLDPAAADPCPCACASGLSFEACCARLPAALPEFR